MEKEKSFDLKQSNFIYLFLISSFLCISLGSGFFVLLWPDLFTKYALETTTVLQLFAYIPLIVYAIKSNTDIKSVLRIKPLKAKQVVLTVLLVLAGYVIVTFVGMIWESFLMLLGLNVNVPSALNDIFNKPVWFSIFLICIYAPFFEEFIFRGMILSGYSAYNGVLKSAVITGCFFGLLHGFLPSVLPTAFLGVMMAALVIYTGSIFSSVIYHVLHNLLTYVLVMDDYFINLPWKLNLAPSLETVPGQVSKFIWILCWTVVAVIAAVFIFRALKKDYVPAPKKHMNPKDKKHKLLCVFAVILAAIMVVLSSITMFLPSGSLG